MTEYLVIIEQEEKNFGGYFVDIEGIYAVGDSAEEVVERLRSALAERIKNGEKFPAPHSRAMAIAV